MCSISISQTQNFIENAILYGLEIAAGNLTKEFSWYLIGVSLGQASDRSKNFLLQVGGKLFPVLENPK